MPSVYIHVTGEVGGYCKAGSTDLESLVLQFSLNEHRYDGTNK